MSTHPILRTGQRVHSFTTNNLPILPPTTNHTVRVYRWYTHCSTYTRQNPISRYPHGHTGTWLGNPIQNINRQRPGHAHTTFRIPRHLVIHLPNNGSIPIHHKNLKITILIHQHLPLPHITLRALESLMGILSFLGQFHSVLKLALFPIYQIMHHHEVNTHKVTNSTIQMATIAPHLLYIVSIWHPGYTVLYVVCCYTNNSIYLIYLITATDWTMYFTCNHIGYSN
jgi:hypothetical protein